MSRLFHRVAIGLIAIGLVIVFYSLWRVQSAQTTFAAETALPSVILTTNWKIPVKPLTAASVSPDGRFIVTIGPEDTVTCRNAQGKLIWQTQVKHATHGLISSGGSVAMVYSWMNPAESHVTFIARDGSVRWHQKVTGAIWCAAVAQNDSLFAVGTGEKWVYIYSVEEYRKRYARWRLPGVVNSLAFFPDGKYVAYGTWQNSSVGVSELDGTKIWQQPGDPDKLYSVSVSAAGKHVLAVGVPNRRLPNAVVSLYTVENNLLWTRTVDGLDVRGDILNLGYGAALSYKKVITQKDRDVAGRYISLVSRSGGQQWQKGGMFFQPQFIAFTREGMLVHDDRSLYGLDLSGKVTSMLKLPATVRFCATDSAGRSIVVYCGDGNLYSLAVKTR